MRKWSEYLCEDVRLAVAEKRHAHEVWLQRDAREMQGKECR